MAITKKKTVKKKRVTKAKEQLVKRPETVDDVREFDPTILAQEFDLNEMQTKFAYFYVFVTQLNGPLAVELAGYSVGQCYDNYEEKAKEYYINLLRKQQAKNLLDNPRIIKFITKLREEMGNQLIVDKLYVISNLKRLAETASESVQLRALEKLGETMEMFSQKQVVEEREDPSKIAAARYEKRLKEEFQNKVVEFTKTGEE